jgi:phosphate-selective porin OprO/OprP
MKGSLFVPAIICLGLPFGAMAEREWPVKVRIGENIDFALTGHDQYDAITARGDMAIDGAHAYRRKELGFTVAQKDAWQAMVYYELRSKRWFDVTWRLDSRWLLGEDYGKIRFGYSRPPVGFEGITASRTTSFMELALPLQAFFESRRTGVDWSFERSKYRIDAGYYFAQDLQGDNDGRTILAHTAWTPRKSEGDVIHIGIALSLESPKSTVDGRGQRNPAAVRWRAKPETGLTDSYLVDTGSIAHVRRNRRSGIESLWIGGPWSLQGEYLWERSDRRDLPSVSGSGYYALVSYVLTGESRGYVSGNVRNVKPSRRWGALELLIRYSAVDLNDRDIQGGRAHDVTAGINWYLTEHFRLQANYVRAHSAKTGTRRRADILALRAQVSF